MFPKKLLIALTLATALASAGVLRAADQSTGRLVINVRPDVLLTAPASLETSAIATPNGNQWTAQFNLRVEAKLRLAPGTTAELAIEPLLSAATGVGADLHGEVSVNGASKPIDTASPATVPFSASGTQAPPVAFTLHGTGDLASASMPVRYTLRSSDGALNWTSFTTLHWTAAQ
jgi:hypothetical protein